MKVKEVLKNLGEKFLLELFPEDFECYCCSAELATKNEYMLCEKCLSLIKTIKCPCKICGDELNSFTDICDNCKNCKRYFDCVASKTNFDGIARTMVHNLKYNNCLYLAKTIGVFLKDTFENCNFNKIDLVTCVPISSERLKSRGYNQAEEIMKEFNKFYNFNYSSSCLKRDRDTISQTELSRAERNKNLKTAFKVTDTNLIKDKTILVIDDVITTGSTLNEIAKVLKENGAKTVYGLTFCHTPMNNYLNKKTL